MYQPALRPEQIKALYYLKLKVGRPMTELVREAIEIYLKEHGGANGLIPASESGHFRNLCLIHWSRQSMSHTGQTQKSRTTILMSVKRPKAEDARRRWHFCYVPKAEVARRWRHFRYVP